MHKLTVNKQLIEIRTCKNQLLINKVLKEDNDCWSQAQTVLEDPGYFYQNNNYYSVLN